jgi:ribosomal protein S18 acetylase RimI-like enzyme
MINLKLDSKMIGLPNLNLSSFDLAADRLNEAFSEDPCFKYFLGSEEYNYIKAKRIHKYALKLGMLYGSILISSDLLEGVSIWLPPTRVDVTSWMLVRAGGLKLIKSGEGIIKNIIKYSNYSLKIHHQNVSTPHWYLLSIGVGKEYQGKGFAGKMLKPVFNHFDQTGYPCYLETHNPNNIKFYENYGFKVVEVGVLPNSEKKHYAMLRMPNA